MSMSHKTICLDFDGVLNLYTKWDGEENLYEPRPGVKEFLKALNDQGYELVVHSTRSAVKIARWLSKHELSQFISGTYNEKPKATIYLDDRALRFDGDFGQALAAIRDWPGTHWEPKEPKRRPTIDELEAILDKLIQARINERFGDLSLDKGFDIRRHTEEQRQAHIKHLEENPRTLITVEGKPLSEIIIEDRGE